MSRILPLWREIKILEKRQAPLPSTPYERRRNLLPPQTSFYVRQNMLCLRTPAIASIMSIEVDCLRRSTKVGTLFFDDKHELQFTSGATSSDLRS
ncbi:hypothetical protein Nepgr_017814 [Nepenthes gracilis]|uniref:Uncharacterized protein n=1 Tax=Nepenthes gracilis TaxID=150966 RepID=A0AAD3XSU6_NEPGR|nr:hypothetical protein Nepgr_017814 [Nepenthes gracilis]